MIPIDFHKKMTPLEENAALDEYCDLILLNRRSDKIRPLDTWCRQNIGLKNSDGTLIDWNFRRVIAASPEELIAIANIIDNLPGNRPDDPYQEMVGISQYVAGRLYHDLSKCGAKELLVRKLNLSVCPYCNRNYVTQISLRGGLLPTFELDHFFPKGGGNAGGQNSSTRYYPLLAVSFYNLIPVCHFCNYVKRDERLQAFYPHAFDWNESHKISFRYVPKAIDFDTNPDSIEIKLDVNTGNTQNPNPYAEWSDFDVFHDIHLLHLEEVYQTHRKEVCNLILKHEIWSAEYADMICRQFSSYFSSSKEVELLMYDEPEDDEEVAQRPLGKLRKDILEQLKEEADT